MRRYITVNRDLLFQKIDESYNLGELKTLCFNLGRTYDYDKLGGEGKEEKIRELVAKAERMEQLEELAYQCASDRPQSMSLQDITELQHFPAKVFGKIWKYIAIVTLLTAILLLLYVLFILNRRPVLSDQLLAASIISASFKANDFYPRVIDLRTAAEEGIPVGEGNSLQLFDIWISVAGPIEPGSNIWAEIYVDQRLTEIIGVVPGPDTAQVGLNRLGDVQVDENYKYSTEKSHLWRVRPSWENLYIALLTQENDEHILIDVTTIRLKEGGDAWFIEPPNVSFVSVEYSVNDGPIKLLDLREATTKGIDVEPGDTFTLHRVSFHANAIGERILETEAYITSNENGGFDQSTFCSNEHSSIRIGIHSVSLDENVICQDGSTTFSWKIPENRPSLTLSFEGSDGTLLDRLVIPFSGENGSLGLVAIDETVRWPFEDAIYLDFEQEGELLEWAADEEANSTISISTEQAFSGVQSLAVTTARSGNQVMAFWNHPAESDVIVGQVYWPNQEGVRVTWAEVCVRSGGEAQCSGIPTSFDLWNPFAINLHDPILGENDVAPEIVEFAKGSFDYLYVQADIESSGSSPYTFYVDGVQLLPVEGDK